MCCDGRRCVLCLKIQRRLRRQAKTKAHSFCWTCSTRKDLLATLLSCFTGIAAVRYSMLFARAGSEREVAASAAQVAVGRWITKAGQRWKNNCETYVWLMQERGHTHHGHEGLRSGSEGILCTVLIRWECTKGREREIKYSSKAQVFHIWKLGMSLLLCLNLNVSLRPRKPHQKKANKHETLM